jgi:hypothetical protein
MLGRLLDMFGFSLAFFMLPFAVLGLLSAALSRGGILLRLAGIGVVTSAGAEVTRARAFARAVVSWILFLPFGVAAFRLVAATVRGSPSEPSPWVLAPLLLWLAGVGWAAYDPQRGLQDHLAGTYLVPR